MPTNGSQNLELSRSDHFVRPRTAGNISGVVYSIYLTFLLIGMCLLGELGDSRIGPGARKHQGTALVCTPDLQVALCRQQSAPQNASEVGRRLCCGFQETALSALLHLWGLYSTDAERTLVLLYLTR